MKQWKRFFAMTLLNSALAVFISLTSGPACTGMEDNSCAAKGTCSELVSAEEMRQTCIQVMENDSGELACIEGIQQGEFQRGAVEFCRYQVQYDSNKNNCLAAIEGRRFSAEKLDFCALNLENDSGELACLEILAETNPTPDQLEFCAHSVQYDSNTLECLRQFAR